MAVRLTGMAYLSRALTPRMPREASLEPPALMHATQVPRPFHTKGSVYEDKYDGWRMVRSRKLAAPLLPTLALARHTVHQCIRNGKGAERE